MVQQTLNYKEKNMSKLYLTIATVVFSVIAVIAIVFLYLINNSALTKVDEVEEVTLEIQEHPDVLDHINHVTIYPTNQLIYLAYSDTNVYVFSEELELLDFYRLVAVRSQEEMIKEFSRSFSQMLLGYDVSKGILIYEIKVISKEQVG